MSKFDSNLLRCDALKRIESTTMHRLEAGNVLCLKALGAFSLLQIPLPDLR